MGDVKGGEFMGVGVGVGSGSRDSTSSSSSEPRIIDSSNIGFQLLKKHGWKEGTGLGISEQFINKLILCDII
ncbi:hypothetical protein CsSME_00042552 [Camellia sinensis var. sinensis]